MKREEELLRLATLIVLETPDRKNPYSHSAYVRWDLIRKVEDVLVALYGVDLKRMRATMRQIKRQGKLENSQ